MIETVVALLMFINGEIKEHRIQEIWLDVYEVRELPREIIILM